MRCEVSEVGGPVEGKWMLYVLGENWYVLYILAGKLVCVTHSERWMVHIQRDEWCTFREMDGTHSERWMVHIQRDGWYTFREMDGTQ
jgi:hypothetical protein